MFSLLSSSVHIVVLRQFLHKGREGIQPATIGSNSVPESLVASCTRHIDFLSRISANCARVSLPTVQHLLEMLKSYFSLVVEEQPSSGILQWADLMLHRWKGEGTGIKPLNQVLAMAEWTSEISPWSNVLEGVVQLNEEQRKTIVRICDPGIRLCQPGIFDLSIVYV